MNFDQLHEQWRNEEVSTPEISLENQKKIHNPLEKIRKNMRMEFWSSVFIIVFLLIFLYIKIDIPKLRIYVLTLVSVMVFVSAFYFKKFFMLYKDLLNNSLNTMDTLKMPYSVRFFYNEGPSEKGLFLSTIQSRKNVLDQTNEFSTDLPLDQLSFVVSTQKPMTSSLITSETKAPISFPYQVVNDKEMGSINGVPYVQINNLVSAQGGGTFYFHYNRKAGSGILGVEGANF